MGLRRGAWVDTLDVRILRGLLRDKSLSPLSSDFRESLSALSRKLHADEATVRRRLKKFRDSGFLADWHLFVNPRLWGGGQVSVWLDVDPAVPKRDLVEAVRLVPGVILATATYDCLIAILEYDDERSVPRSVELLRRVASTTTSFVGRIPFPECTAALRARDWDLIRVLRRNPKRPYGELAAEAGLSDRTVRMKLSRLTGEGALFGWPSLNFRAAEGGVCVHLVAWYPGELKDEVDRTVTRHLEPYLWHVNHMMPYRSGDLWPCGYDLLLPNIAAAREALTWMKDVSGVERARLCLREDNFNFWDSYDEILERKLSQLPSMLPRARLGVGRRRTSRSPNHARPSSVVIR